MKTPDLARLPGARRLVATSDRAVSAITSSPIDRLSTGAPMPPPTWQLICEFANGSCVCAHTRADGPPCHAVEVITDRVKNRILHDQATIDRGRRKATNE